MTAGGDSALMTYMWQAWVQYVVDYRKNKEFEDAVEKQEQQLKAYMENKKKNAKGVLDRMNSASAQGLLSLMVTKWAEYLKEEKSARELDNALSATNNKLMNLKGRQSNNAKSVQSRINDSMDMLLSMKCFSAWNFDIKSERLRGDMEKKIDYKRKKLGSIQVLFKDFASQLEQGLADNDGDITSHRSGQAGRRQGSNRKGNRSSGRNSLSKDESLPDINQKSGVA